MISWVCHKIPRANGVPGVSSGRGLLIPLGYLHTGKCEHSEVQSHRFCHGRFFSLCACASHHWFKKYGGLWRTIMKSEHWRLAKSRKRRQERLPQDYKRLLRRDKCWEKTETTLDWNTKQVCWYIVCTKLLRNYIKGRRSRIQSVHCHCLIPE